MKIFFIEIIRKNKIFFFSHLVLSLILFFAVGFEYVESWHFFWQNLNEKYLFFNNGAFQNLWLLHSQPPLHNFFYSLILNVFYPDQPTAFKIIQAVCGALFICNLFFIVDIFFNSKYIRIFLKAAVFFNPSVFLFENYYLYTLNSALLVSMIISLLILFFKYKKNEFVIYMILSVNILILYRSSFHLIFLVPVFIYMILFLQLPKKIYLYSVIISMLSIGWYAKNYIHYGFFGASSWQGLNLYKFLTSDFNAQTVKKLEKKMNIDRLFYNTNHFFTEPRVYEKFGFNKKTDRLFLNDNNWHNINVVDISKKYNEFSIEIIKKIPMIYLANILGAYDLFSMPAYTFPHLSNNAVKISGWISIYNNIFYFDNFIFRLFSKKNYNFYFVSKYIAPLLIFLFFIKFILHYLKSEVNSDVDKIVVFIIIILVYYSAVSCMFEIGENNRFRFAVESLIYINVFYIALKFTGKFTGKSAEKTK